MSKSRSLHSSPTSSRPGRRPGGVAAGERQASRRLLRDPRQDRTTNTCRRDLYRAEAKDEAKKIRRAVEWLKVLLDRNDREYRYATYRASW